MGIGVGGRLDSGESSVAGQSCGSKVVSHAHVLPPTPASQSQFCSDLDRQADEPVALSGEGAVTATLQPSNFAVPLGFPATSDQPVECGQVSQGVGLLCQCVICASPLAVAEHVCHPEMSVLSHAVCPLCVDQVGWAAVASSCSSDVGHRPTLVLGPTASEVEVRRHRLDFAMSADLSKHAVVPHFNFLSNPCAPSFPEGPNPNLPKQSGEWLQVESVQALKQCAPSLHEGPHPNLHKQSVDWLQTEHGQAPKQCLICGQSHVLGLDPQPEVQAFVSACREAQLAQLCEGVAEALNDTLSYCSGCLCKWAAKVDASRRAHRQYPILVSGPAFFHDIGDEQEFDLQSDLDFVPSMPQVEQVQVRACTYEHSQRPVPVSRRSRRRYNRRLRLASCGNSDFLEPLIEPLCCAQGAPKTSEEEVMTGSWTIHQEVGGRWPGGLGGPELVDANHSAWTTSDVHCHALPGLLPGTETNPHFEAQKGTLSGSPTYFPGQALDNAFELPVKHSEQPNVRPVGGTWSDSQKRLLTDLRQAVLAGDSAPLLDIVEKMEQQGAIKEGTFGWKAAELAVETQEDVPKHVACWALDDALANLVAPKPRADVQVITANITSWRKDLCLWISQQKADVFMLQETHLSPDKPDLIEAQLGFYGYNVFSIPAHPTGKGGTSGGLAICFRKHLNLRRVHHYVRDGAGFQVAALRLKDVDCYLVNVYLKSGEGFQGSHNAPILATLIAFLRSVQGIYFVAGDFNEDFEVIAATSLEQEAKGRWISSGESTCAGGGNIDFGLLAPVLAAGAHVSLDWVTPFAPHAALHWTLQLQHFDMRLPQLVPFKPAQVQAQPFRLHLDFSPQGEQNALLRSEGSVHLLGLEMVQPSLSALFASLSHDVEVSIFGFSQGRGAQVQCCRKPLLMPTSPAAGWGGKFVSFWNRVVTWLEACSRRFHVSSFGRSVAHALAGMWHSQSSDFEIFASQLNDLISEEAVGLLPTLLEVAKKQQKLHANMWQQEKSASYNKWLSKSTIKGMRPLFKSVKAEEMITVRPFLDAPVQERIYLRWRQWYDLWSHPEGVDPDLLSSLKSLALEQARHLKPIDLKSAVSFFRKIPSKAPGLDGWTCEVLLNLSVEAVQAILDFFHYCERQAAWPDQMVFALIALLPKSEKRERPIALLHILYRSWAKLRWPLVAAWQVEYSRRAPWDKAVPGSQVLDVALARLMLGEQVRRSKRHLITLFLDCETFYDRCLFNDVISSGISLAYPPLILHQAMLTYMGPRLVQSEGSLCPPIWPGRGVLAGCPAAPSVTKLVIHPVAAKLAAKKSASNLDIWIDDLTLDSVNESPLQVASDSLKLFKGLKLDLESKGAQISISKTCFVASSTEAAKALGKLLDKSDPQVKTMNRDLGITSAGGRRRVLGLAENRRQKAAGRARKLKKLSVPGRAHRLRIVRASLCSAGLWGHQAQGVSPKRRKFYRTLVAKHLGHQKLGCLDLTFIVNRRRCEDPNLTLLKQHVRATARVFRRWQSSEPGKFKSTWADIWAWLTASLHPWKKVNGPMAALMAYLHELGVQAPQAHRWHKDDNSLTIDWSSSDATRRVWHWLLPVWEHVRLQRISLYDGCQALGDGIDVTVPERLQRRKFFNKNMAVNLQALWQGALVSHSKQGWCTLCSCPLDLQHVLWDCPYISNPFPAPLHFSQARKQYPWDSLWLRGLVPREATRLGCPCNAAGFKLDGLWSSHQVISSDSLVFASDAAGGPGARDHRAACVTWSLAAYRLEPDGPKRVASITCVPERPLTVAAAEQQAAFELFRRVSGSFDLTVDCKAVTHVLAKPSPPLEGPVPWGEVWDDRARASVTWVPSHKSKAYFAERELEEWRRIINDDVDCLCGARSAEVFASAHKPSLKVIDRLCEEICLHLAKKVGFILKHRKDKAFPWVMQRGGTASQAEESSSRVIGGDKFVKTKGPKVSKPNKKQRLKDMLANPDPDLGHVWRDCESKAVNNFAIQCTVCQLYLEQCNPQDVFDRKANNPCKDREAVLPQSWQVHPTHDMSNKGSFFTCTKCFAIAKIAVSSVSALLQGPCQGLGRKMNSRTQVRTMAKVEGSKSRSIAASLQGHRHPEEAGDLPSTRPAAQPGPQVSAKPKPKTKARSKDGSVQTRLSFK